MRWNTHIILTMIFIGTDCRFVQRQFGALRLDFGDSAATQEVALQVTRLKRAAESRFDSILKSIRQNGASPSPASSASAGPADLQARLEAAIGVLQDGLIERDTEASGPQHPQHCQEAPFLRPRVHCLHLTCCWS